MEEELAQRMIRDYGRTRENYRRKITALFTEVGVHFQERGVATPVLHQEHDVHAFYRLSKDASRVVHVQGYPGLSSEQQAVVLARLIDYSRMLAIRTRGDSIGKEHEAVIQTLISQTGMPYDPRVLEERLAENVHELR